jgi:hypothetical protein
MRGQTCKFEGCDMPMVGDTDDNRLAVNPHAIVKGKDKGHFFGQLKGHHRAYRKPLFGKVAHHPAVGRRKLDVDKADRALAQPSPAFGPDSHSKVQLGEF